MNTPSPELLRHIKNRLAVRPNERGWENAMAQRLVDYFKIATDVVNIDHDTRAEHARHLIRLKELDSQRLAVQAECDHPTTSYQAGAIASEAVTRCCICGKEL